MRRGLALTPVISSTSKDSSFEILPSWSVSAFWKEPMIVSSLSWYFGVAFRYALRASILIPLVFTPSSVNSMSLVITSFLRFSVYSVVFNSFSLLLSPLVSDEDLFLVGV